MGKKNAGLYVLLAFLLIFYSFYPPFFNSIYSGVCSAASYSSYGGHGASTAAQSFSNLQGLMGSLPSVPSGTNLQSLKSKYLAAKAKSAKKAHRKKKSSKTVIPQKKISPLLLKLSKIEKVYRRLYPFVKPLKQFGYKYFIGKTIKTTMVGAVGNSYVVGPGDSLNIYVSGSPAEVLGIPGVINNIKVNREGFINIPYIGTIYVWNKTLGEIKDLINAKFSQRFKNVSVSVSVNKLRQFMVYVSGFVRNPGPILANGTMSVMDALILAGGVSREGSLRNILITVKTKSGTYVRRIDLYDLLLKGIPVNSYLSAGEVIYASPIGRTAAVYGSVKRPAIYEIRSDTTNAQLIYSMAGGPQFFSHKKSVKIIKLVNGKFKTLTVNLNSEKFLNQNAKNGEIIVLNNLYSALKNTVYVFGKVSYPGIYSVKTTPDLKDLIKKIGIMFDTNLNYAQIVRKYERRIIKFSPKEALEGKFNIKLKSGDKIVFYPKWIRKPVEISGDYIKTPVFVSYNKGLTLLKALGNVSFTIPPKNLKAYVFAGNHYYTSLKKYGRVVKVVFLHNLFNHQTPKNNVVLLPGESVLIKKINPTELVSSVTILGQVSRPGVYRLKKGMRLYDLIIKAGGYTSAAYPKALVFIRRSVKRIQSIQLNEAIMDIQNNMSAVPVTGIGTATEQSLAYQSVITQEKQYIASLKTVGLQGLGRIALKIPNRLRYLKYSRENIKIRSGDFIFIPPKPDFVLVMGSVFNQIAIPYIPGKTVGWYLNQAGGAKANADAGQAYLIQADGRAVSAAQMSSFWSFMGIGPNFYDMPVKPGDAIAFPPKFQAPILWMPLIKDVTQIIFNSIATVAMVRYL